MASPPRRRRTTAPSLPSSRNDSEPAPQSAVLLSGPSSHASEPAIPATRHAFPPALFDQLVQRVAAEVTRHLQPASFLPAVQEPEVPSPAPAAFPSLDGMTAVQQLTTEVPVVSSSPVCNPSAEDQVAQVVQSIHSSLAGESPSTGAFQPKDIFTSVNLPVNARVPLKLKPKSGIMNLLTLVCSWPTNLPKENISSPLILVMALHPLWLLSPLLSLRKLCP